MGLREAPTILPTFFRFLSLATRHSSLATRHFFLPRPSFASLASRMALRDRAEQADGSLALCSCKGSACAAEESLFALIHLPPLSSRLPPTLPEGICFASRRVHL